MRTLIDKTIERYRRFVILHADRSMQKEPAMLTPQRHLEEAAWGIEGYIDARLRKARTTPY